MIAFHLGLILLHRRFPNDVLDLLAVPHFREVVEGIQPEALVVGLHDRAGDEAVLALLTQENGDGFRPLGFIVADPALHAVDINLFLVGNLLQPVMHPQQRVARVVERSVRTGPDGVLLIFVVLGLAVQRIVEGNEVVVIAVRLNGRVVGNAADPGFPQGVGGHMAVDVQGKILPRIRPAVFPQHTLVAFASGGIQRSAVAPQFYLYRHLLAGRRGRVPIRLYRHGEQLLGSIAKGNQRGIAQAGVFVGDRLTIGIGQGLDCAAVLYCEADGRSADVALGGNFGQSVIARFQMQVHMAVSVGRHPVIRYHFRKVPVAAVFAGVGLAGQLQGCVRPGQGEFHALQGCVGERVDLEQRQNVPLRIDILERYRLVGRGGQVVGVGLRHHLHLFRSVVSFPAGRRTGGAGDAVTVDVVPFALRQVIPFRQGILPQRVPIQDPRVCIRGGVIFRIAGLPRPGLLSGGLQTQLKVGNGSVFLLRVVGHKDGIAAVFDRFHSRLIAGEGFGHAKVGLLRHQNAVHMPAVRRFIFDHVPADGKVIRRDDFRRKRLAVQRNSIAAFPDMRQHILV